MIDREGVPYYILEMKNIASRMWHCPVWHKFRNLPVQLHNVALHKSVYLCLQTSEHHSYALNKITTIHMTKNPYWNKYCVRLNIRWFFTGVFCTEEERPSVKEALANLAETHIRNVSLSSKYWPIRHAVMMFGLDQYYCECFWIIYIKIY